MHQTDIRNRPLTRVVNLDDGNVVTVAGNFQGIFIARRAIRIGIQHVGKHESRAFLLHSVRQVPQSLSDICSVGFRLELDDLTDDVEQMAAALLRRDELLYPVAEEKRPDLVVVDYVEK